MVDREQDSRGLYTPELEHDACGIGFVAHLKNRKSHQVVTQALDMLARMEHRVAKVVTHVLVMAQVSYYKNLMSFYSKRPLNLA